MKKVSALVLFVLWSAVFATAALVSGCQSTTPERDFAEEYFSLSVSSDRWLPIIEAKPATPGDVRDLRNCAETSFTPPPRGPWDDIDNKRMAEAKVAEHRSSDRLLRVGEPIQVGATISYGETALTREWVRLFIGTCDGWRQVADGRTDKEGQIEFRLPNRLPAGVYGVAFQVVGDGSMVKSELWVLPRETEVVGLELNGAVLSEGVKNGSPVSGAADLAAHYTAQGHLVAYFDLERPATYDLEEVRARMRKEGFPVGPILRATEGEEKSKGAKEEEQADDDQEVNADDDQEAALASEEQELENGARDNGVAKVSLTRLTLATIYGADAGIVERLQQMGLKAEEVVSLEKFCQSRRNGAGECGWSSVLESVKAQAEGQ